MRLGSGRDACRGNRAAKKKETAAMMVDKDGVITEAAKCADAQGREVREALTAYVQAATKADEQFAEQRLRVALVAQSVGHESSAHDGATARARVEHATRALEAWDGRKWEEGPPKMVTIRLGATVLRGSALLASKLGWTTYAGSDEGQVTGQGDGHIAELAEALSEGLSGDRALLRAIALTNQRGEQANADRRHAEIAAAEEKAAGMRLAAEREISKRFK
jgi:hypothetical protein